MQGFDPLKFVPCIEHVEIGIFYYDETMQLNLTKNFELNMEWVLNVYLNHLIFF